MSLADRLQQLDREITGIERVRDTRLADLKALEQEVEALTDEVDLIDKVEQVLQQISSKILGKSTKTIDKLVTVGLKLVFDDQKLEFKTVVDKYRGKTSIRFELYDNGETAPLMDSYGGGVIAVVGVLLRVVTIIVLNQRRILVLDESLSHVAEVYQANASALLRKLCNDLKFTIMMVTHQDGFVEHADRHYEAVRVNGATEFKLIKGSP